MGWVVWLAAPVAVTAVVALLSWVRSRPVRHLGTDDAMRAHDGFLEALVQTARSKDRGPLAGTAAEDRPPTPDGAHDRPV